jgi:hypothetical protein
MSDFPHRFEEYLESLKAQDTFRTYSVVFESALEDETRKHLIENPVTEIRSGVRGVSDDGVLEKQNCFYTIGVFLKCLNEMGFEVTETVEEDFDFTSVLTHKNLSLEVGFDYSFDNHVEYKVMFSDDREHTGHKDVHGFLEGIFKGGWGLPNFEGLLDTNNLYEDLETFMRDFRKAWGQYQNTLKEKTG